MTGVQGTIACPLFLLFSLSTSTAVPAQRDPLQGFDAYVQKSMAEWQVPGLAIAVVKDEKVVFLKGYGLREIGKDAIVDGQTIFPLASVTKPFTSGHFWAYGGICHTRCRKTRTDRVGFLRRKHGGGRKDKPG